MATQLQIRRGTSTQVAAFTGAEGEIVVNTTNDSVHVNDGSTQGGFELARVDGSNWNVTNNISTTGSVTAKNMSLIQNSGFANLEMGGPSGAFIDLKSPSSDDFDGRIITTGSGMTLDVASASTLVLQAGGENRIEIDAGGEIAINEAGLDRDFRVESDGNTHMLFVDAGNNRVGIGTSSPSTLVEASESQNTVTDVKVVNANTGTAAQARFTLGNSGANFGALGLLGGSFTTAGVYRQDGVYLFANGGGGLSLVTGAAQPIYFAINNSEKMRILENGRVSIGGTSSNHLLNVTSSTTPALEFTRGSGNATIGIDNGNSIAVGGTAGDLVLRASGTTGVTKFTDSGGNITMTLTESNNVGITGQTNPTFNLDGGFVTQTWGWHLNTSYQAGFTYTTTDRSLSIFTKSADNADYIKFSTGGSALERGRLTAAGNFGLGISSPSAILHVKNTTSASQIKISDATNTSELQVASNGFYFNNPVNAGTFIFRNGTGLTERARITSSGILQLAGGGNDSVGEINFGNTAQNANRLQIRHQSSSWIIKTVDSEPLLFGTANSEVARFDTGNNFLVATTNNSPVGNNVAGIGLMANGSAQISRDGGAPLFVNRKTSNGDLIILRKDGSTVGTQGAIDGDLYVASGASGHKGLRFGNGYIAPTNNAGTIQDNSTDLGISSHRFQDLFLSGGVFLGGTDSPHHLEYYEDGITWTPSQSGVTLSVTTATAIRVGSLVTINARIVFPGNSDTTVVAISGLPFARASHYQSAGGVMHSNVNLPNGYTQLAYYLGGSSINLYACGDGLAFAAMRNNNLSGADIIFTISYETNA